MQALRDCQTKPVVMAGMRKTPASPLAVLALDKTPAGPYTVLALKRDADSANVHLYAIDSELERLRRWLSGCAGAIASTIAARTHSDSLAVVALLEVYERYDGMVAIRLLIEPNEGDIVINPREYGIPEGLLTE
jgi:hypothetical protein